MNYLSYLELQRSSNAYNVGSSKVSRAFTDEVCIKLECGYVQRFFIVEQKDEDLIERTLYMKNQGIEPASFNF